MNFKSKVLIKYILGSFLGSALIVGGAIRCSSSSSSTATTSTTDSDSDTSTEDIIMAASSSASPSTTSATHSDTYYYTPFHFSTILANSYVPTGLATTTSLSNRTRYMIKSSSSGKYIALNSSGVASANSTLSTYSDTLSKIFEVVTDSNNSSYFRLDSELHSLFSLDVNNSTGSVYFADNWGNAASPTGRGYVVFSYDSNTKLIQAKARYSYNLTTLTHSTTADASFTYANYYLAESGGSLSVVSSSGSATQFDIYSSPLDVTMPTDFNPTSIAYQTNSRVAILSYVNNATTDMEGNSGHVKQNLLSAYSSQLTATGDDSSTETAASTMLDTIETTLASEGSSLRYPKALYLAFRKGALQTTLQSHNIANGTYGMSNVPYVFFTNAADSSGVHHPFMVIASYSIADKPNRLYDVSRPPGDGTTSGYAT